MTTKDKGASPLELDNKLKAMPEYALVQEINGLSRSLKLFDGNYQQLREKLSFFEDASKSLYLNKAGHERENDEFRSEVVRLMHNYVAAAFSLVDHSRRHYRVLYKGGNFPEYLERVKLEFADDIFANFVKGLRNHFQHFGLPGVEFQTHWSKGAPAFKRTVHLNNQELKRFEWDSKARQYLEAQTEDINLIQLVDRYHEKVSSFYGWFQERQSEIHAAEINVVEALRAEIRRLVLPDIVQATLQFPGMNATTFEANIVRLLPYQEQTAFGLMEQDDKPKFLITILQKMADLSPALEKSILSLYKANGEH